MNILIYRFITHTLYFSGTLFVIMRTAAVNEKLDFTSTSRMLIFLIISCKTFLNRTPIGEHRERRLVI